METKLPRTGCFITVRTDSSRLPGKALRFIRGKRVIEHIIERAKHVRKADLVVLCTTDRPVDDTLAAIASEQGVSCYRGSLHNVFMRWHNAAEQFAIDYFATYDADDLFCEPRFMDLAIGRALEGTFDVVRGPEGLICGSSTYAISRTGLRRVCADLKDSDSMEMHQWLHLADMGSYTLGTFTIKDPLFYDDTIRLTLDYQEDFDFFKAVFDGLSINTNNLPLSTIVTFLKERPELSTINIFRQQHYVDNQMEKLKQVTQHYAQKKTKA